MRVLTRIIATVWAAAALAAGAQVGYQWTDITPANVTRVNGSVESMGTHPLDRNRLIVRGTFFEPGAFNGPFYPVMYSNDAGRSWNYPDSALTGSFSSMFVDVARPGVVYLESRGSPGVISGPNPGRLYRSEDFGRTWSAVYTIALADELHPFATDPLDAHGIYAFYQQYYFLQICCGAPVGTRNYGITRTHNDGSDWSAPVAAPSGYYAFLEGPTPSAPKRLFIGSFDYPTVLNVDRKTFVSLDSGATWSRADSAAPSPLSWIRPDPQHANVLYGYSHETVDRFKLLRSDDGGATWREIFFSRTTPPNLTIDPARPNVLWMPYGTDTIYRSQDLGETWHQVPYPFMDLPPNYDPGATMVPSPAEPGVVYLVRYRRLFRGVPVAAPDPVVVEFEYEGNRYWSTSLDGEAVSQDYRQQPGDVHRTGLRWGAWGSAGAPAGALGSCRFWPRPEIGRTRVLVQQGFECEALKRSPGWILEAENEFFTLPPANNACPAGTVSVHRFINLKADFNHRWVADSAAMAEMRARGWFDEGVRFCARPLGNNE